MTLYPLAQVVAVRTFVEGATDPFGNPAESWAAPVDVPVFGFAPAGTSEPFGVGRDAVAWDLDLFAGPDFTLAARDRVLVLGVEHEVDGRVEDFTHGPFGFAPGVRVRLTRVEG